MRAEHVLYLLYEIVERMWNRQFSRKMNQDTFDWEDDPTIGKVQAGCYKRVGITKKDETYEEMLELRDIANKGYLVVCDDGSKAELVFNSKGEIEFIYIVKGDILMA